MILVQGKNHSWLVYSCSGEPMSDEAIEQAVNNINNTPVKAYVLGGYLDTETTFEKLDGMLNSLREIGMAPGDFAVVLDFGPSQLLLIPEDDTQVENSNESSVEVLD